MASRPDDQGNSDVWCGRELKRGSPEVHAVATGHDPKLVALFDRDRGYLEVLRAVVVTWAPGYEAGIERCPDDQRNVLPANCGEELVHRLCVINQRILPGAKTDVGIGVIHNFQNRKRRINADAPRPYNALVPHL